ncbi:MAG: hypothetical protein GY810_25460 [Aureispira sp.]|nr:hypothetical protein [Aureispira sp.]
MGNIYKVLFFILLPILSYAQTCDLDLENFETSTNLNAPAGWQRLNSYFGNIAPYSGTVHTGFNTLGDQLIVEPLNCPGEICFYWRASGTTSNYDIDIDWSDDNGLTWNTAQTINLNGSSTPTTYSQICVDLPENLYNPPFSDILIRFHQSRRVSGSFYLDDVCISSGTCSLVPTELRVSSLTGNCIPINTPFSLQVCATDNNGYIDPSYTGNITLSKILGTGTLGGTLIQNAVNGCTEFNDLTLSQAGSYDIQATTGTLNGLLTNFEIREQCPSLDTLRVMSYNLLNFPNGRNDCGTNTVIPNRWDSLAIITEYIQPDILMACELQTEEGADSIIHQALNINGKTNYARANFVLNQSNSVKDLNN